MAETRQKTEQKSIKHLPMPPKINVSLTLKVCWFSTILIQFFDSPYSQGKLLIRRIRFIWRIRLIKRHLFAKLSEIVCFLYINFLVKRVASFFHRDSMTRHKGSVRVSFTWKVVCVYAVYICFYGYPLN